MQPLSSRQLESSLLPFYNIDVYTMFRFHPEGLHDDSHEQDIVKAFPSSSSLPEGRFDTVIVMDTDEAEATGLEGLIFLFDLLLFLKFISGTRVGCVKIIFSLPKIIQRPGFQEPAPKEWPTQPLAYVEWYTRQGSLADKTHGMYKIFPAYDSQGCQQGSIIPLSNIRQSCMLIPIFPKPRTQEAKNLESWTPGNILDKAKAFLINNFLDLYTFQTVW